MADQYGTFWGAVGSIAASLRRRLVDNGDGTWSEQIVTIAGAGTPGGTLPAGTDRSGSIATGGTAQVLAAANASRRSLTIQNIDAAEDMWVNENGGTATVATAGSFLIPAKTSATIHTNKAVSVVAATTGHKWTATEV